MLTCMLHTLCHVWLNVGTLQDSPLQAIPYLSASSIMVHSPFTSFHYLGPSLNFHRSLDSKMRKIQASGLSQRHSGSAFLYLYVLVSRLMVGHLIAATRFRVQSHNNISLVDIEDQNTRALLCYYTSSASPGASLTTVGSMQVHQDP